MDLKSTYNKIAKDWAKDHAADDWWIEGTDKFCSLLSPVATVLDVGCGPGFKTKYIADKGFKVTGIYFSEKMIETAKDNYPNFDFQVVDVYDVGKFETKFDAIFAQAVLLHIPKSRVLKVLMDLKSRLNPNGLLYLAVKEIRDNVTEEKIEKENDYGYEYERFFSYFDSNELHDDFRKLDMTIVWENTDSSRPNRSRRWLQIIAKKI